MSSYHPGNQYQAYGYDNQQQYAYGYPSPSSPPTGAYPSSASQSMSSTSPYNDAPSPWQWDGQEWIYPQNTVQTNYSQIDAREQDPQAYPQQIQYQPQQQSQNAPRTQRITGRSPLKENKRYICLEPGCPSTAQHARPADLARHQRTVHRITEWFDCPRSKCTRKGERAFSRKDHLLEHLRCYHGENIPKGGKRGDKH